MKNVVRPAGYFEGMTTDRRNDYLNGVLNAAAFLAANPDQAKALFDAATEAAKENQNLQKFVLKK